jgi:hypothetical protein
METLPALTYKKEGGKPFYYKDIVGSQLTSKGDHFLNLWNYHTGSISRGYRRLKYHALLAIRIVILKKSQPIESGSSFQNVNSKWN